jgi:hypothetical protein
MASRTTLSCTHNTAARDTRRRVRERREAANLPRFSEGGQLQQQPSRMRLLGSLLGTSSGTAPANMTSPGKDAKDLGNMHSSSSDVSAVDKSTELPQPHHLEHHLPARMADGFPVDETENEGGNLLEFKETPAEVSRGRAVEGALARVSMQGLCSRYATCLMKLFQLRCTAPYRHCEMQRRLRTEVFLREVIPWWLAPAGYGGLALLSIIFIPMVLPPVKWYYVAVAYAVGAGWL